MAHHNYHKGTEFKHGFDQTTLLSAALTLADFVSAFGRLPKVRECYAEPSSGLLLNRNTYTKVFGVSTFTQVLCAFSGILSGITWYTCLGHQCEARFPRMQSDVRLCENCRKKRGTEDVWGEGGAVHRQQLRRWGADLEDWSTGIDWGESKG